MALYPDILLCLHINIVFREVHDLDTTILTYSSLEIVQAVDLDIVHIDHGVLVARGNASLVATGPE